MECRKCGVLNEEKNIFCSSCGKRLRKRSLEIKKLDFIVKQQKKMKRIFLFAVTMLLLIMSIGPISSHNAGYINLNEEEQELKYTQSSLHYLEGFKHFLLGTDRSTYSKIVTEQVIDQPVGSTFDSYEESYSHRNLVGYNFLVDDLSLSRAIVILMDISLVFILIGLPLTLFVYLCIELQLKTDKKLRFEWVFLFTGLAGLLLSRFLMPAYSFHVTSSVNLKLYIIFSFLAYFVLLYIRYCDASITKIETNILLRKATYLLILIAVVFFATSNFINIGIWGDGVLLFGKINMRETSELFIMNYDPIVFSESSFSSVFRNYENYSSASYLNWDYFLRIDFVRANLINKIVMYLRVTLALVFMFMVIYYMRCINKYNQFLSTRISRTILIILLYLNLTYVILNLYSVIMMNIAFVRVLEFSAFSVVYPSLSSFIPLVLLIYMLRKQKKDNLLT